MSLTAKTNDLIDIEIGADDGTEFPGPRVLYKL